MAAGLDTGGIRLAGGVEVKPLAPGFVALLFMFCSEGQAQNLQTVIAQGEKIFNQTCATGYCHGAKGAPSGAPRLAARGFDQAFINTTTTRGIPGTAMPAFAGTLSRGDLSAVVAYVATLNGIANPVIAPTGPGGAGGGAPEPALPPESTRGRSLFSDSVRGFGRCSTCHEVQGIGISVTTPVAHIPSDPAGLRGLQTPDIRTARVDGESMPALVVSEGKLRTVFYDLTTAPPVLRTVDSAAVKISDGSSWKHSSVLLAYTDEELAAILSYLRTTVR